MRLFETVTSDCLVTETIRLEQYQSPTKINVEGAYRPRPNLEEVHIKSEDFFRKTSIFEESRVFSYKTLSLGLHLSAPEQNFPIILTT